MNRYVDASLCVLVPGYGPGRSSHFFKAASHVASAAFGLTILLLSHAILLGSLVMLGVLSTGIMYGYQRWVRLGAMPRAAPTLKAKIRQAPRAELVLDEGAEAEEKPLPMVRRGPLQDDGSYLF